MELITDIKNIKLKCELYRNSGYKIGFVPTMGALHDGHISLMKIMRQKVDKVIVSILINQKQFSQNEDYDSYPRTFEEDYKKCKENSIDVLYTPTNEEMYPKDFSTTVSIGELGRVLCGASRINFIDGILLVILKFMNQIKPNFIIFGEKDFQMVFSIKKMIKDLDIDINVITAPTYRETDTLATSSRNVYLDKQQRQKASFLYETLKNIADLAKKNPEELNNIIERNKKDIKERGFELDYLEARDNDTLSKVEVLSGNVRLFVAAYLGKCRLIDNFLITI